MQLFNFTPERFAVVHREISDGSEPAQRFYIMVAISTLIASFGLISNSTAVVIGAMLVAPLMTPIFGISLALVRGEAGLLGRAVRAEILGVIAAVSMGYVLGLLLGDFEATPEMLSRTRPNLFDLLVAVLAGCAGAYALIDEKISPALPGVAIATAIVPPLANSGLCLSLGEVHGGIGSFLLFFANFLSILVVASATFLMSGMARRYGAQAKNIDVVRRFGLPLVGFVLIAIFLGHSLVKIYQDRKITKIIRTSLVEETSRMPATLLGEVYHYSRDDKVNVMAAVHSPKVLAPTEVSRIQDELTQRIGKPVNLIVHCVLSNNVSALGSVNNIIAPKLDGTFIASTDNETLNAIGTAEQIIRIHLSEDKALALLRVEYLKIGQRDVLLAHVLGFRQMSAEEIAVLEARIRESTGDDNLELVVASVEKTLKNDNGTIRYGWILGEQNTPEIRKLIRRVRKDLKNAFEQFDEYELVNINANRLDGKLHFLLEIAGPEVFPRRFLEKLEARLAKNFSEPVVLYAWSRIEVVRGPEGVMPPAKFRRYFRDRQKENLPREIPVILEASAQ